MSAQTPAEINLMHQKNCWDNGDEAAAERAYDALVRVGLEAHAPTQALRGSSPEAEAFARLLRATGAAGAAGAAI